MDELFLILKENQPYKIAQTLAAIQAAQTVSNTHPEANPETIVKISETTSLAPCQYVSRSEGHAQRISRWHKKGRKHY